MKARISRPALAEEVGWVSRVIPARPASPIMNGAHLTAAENKLILTATDGLSSSTTNVDADIAAFGEVVVPGRLLAAISGSLPQKPVTIEAVGSALRISCGRSEFTLPTMPLDDYPKLPQQPEPIGSLLGPEFSDAVSQTTVAAAKDDTLPILTGVQVKTTDAGLTMIATDRYRLAIKKVPWTGSTRQPFLVRAKSLTELAKPTSIGKVVLSMDDESSLLGLSAGTRRSIVPLLAGDFPDVERLVPTGGDLSVSTDVAELVAAVKRVRLVMDRPNQPLRLTFGNDEILLSAGSGSTSEASEVVEAEIQGQRTEVAFNPEYLVEALSALAGATVRFQFNGPAKPVLLDCVDDPSYRHILMPVKADDVAR